jgi:hypothetical protein
VTDALEISSYARLSRFRLTCVPPMEGRLGTFDLNCRPASNRLNQMVSSGPGSDDIRISAAGFIIDDAGHRTRIRAAVCNKRP